MEDRGYSRLHEFLRVKEEPVEYPPPLAVQVKVEPLNEQHSDGIKEEQCAKDAECVNGVKQELQCSDSVDCGVSEAAMLAGLYTDHEVKYEVVLGLECPHRPDVNLVVGKGTRDKRLSNCCVRNERLPSHDEHQTTTKDTTNHADSESDQEEICSSVDCEKELICDLCGVCFALKSDLVKHVIEHIHMPDTMGESGQDVYAFAGECKQEPAQERALYRAYALRDCCVRLERLHDDALLAGNQRPTPALHTTTHADTESDTEDEIYNVDCEKEPTCDICGQSFALKTDLMKHVMIHIHMPTAHDQYLVTTIHSDTEEEIDISIDCENEPVCEFCGKKFTLYSNLMKHVTIHSLGRCTKGPSDTGENKIYVCETCGKTFLQKCYLNRHIQNKHLPTTQKLYSSDASGKLYSCNICKRHFPSPSKLKEHKRVHTGEKPYKCKVCNKSLAYKHTLVVHLRTHTGEKPYSCTVCSRRFVQSSDLIQHRFIHTGEQPYCCTICNKRFSRSTYLKKHNIIHNREQPFSCETCGKKFRSRSGLKKHVKLHAGEKLYSCDICNEQFSDTCQLNTHKKNHVGYALQTFCEIERL